MTAIAEAVNDWALWQSLLQTKGSPKPDSGIAQGFWRIPNGVAGTALPVATWSDDGFWLVSINGADPVDKDCGPAWNEFLAKTWPKLQAVDHSDYTIAIDTGSWPDGTPVAKARGGMGDNSPPEGSTEALLAEAAGHIESANALIRSGAAKSEGEVDLASNLAKTLTETRSKIVAAHKVEKEPHLVAGREVDNRFFPTRDKLDEITRAIKAKVINPWQVEQDRIRREAAEAARKAAAEAAAAGREADPPPSEPIKVTSGSRGRKVSLVDEKFAELADPEAFAAFLTKNRSPAIMPALESAAAALARNVMNPEGSNPAPGVFVRVRKVSR